MNIKEIEQIEDVELRKIRMKYWNLKHKAFLDEHGISDQEIGDVFDSLTKKEEGYALGNLPVIITENGMAAHGTISMD